jgi:uncharacterized membrane-anchored protein YhcB (DUF1043 family)
MRGRLFLLVVLVVVGVFVVAFNWESMTVGVRLDLLFTTVVTTVGALVGLVALALTAVFLLGALLDRAKYLQQLSQMERHLEEARTELDRKRAADVAALSDEVAERFEGLRDALDGAAARLGVELGDRLEDVRGELAERIDAVRERVVVVRDELAADVAELEDALLRRRDGAVEEPEL